MHMLCAHGLLWILAGVVHGHVDYHDPIPYRCRESTSFLTIFMNIRMTNVWTIPASNMEFLTHILVPSLATKRARMEADQGWASN